MYLYANFYPESLTYLLEFGRYPGLRLYVSLPKSKITSSDKKCNIKHYSLQLREQLKNKN